MVGFLRGNLCRYNGFIDCFGKSELLVISNLISFCFNFLLKGYIDFFFVSKWMNGKSYW